jgi:uncharacterized protein (TIGR02687 family)
MTDKIIKALTDLFQQYRIVIWYDDKAEMQFLYHTIELDGIQKLEIRNNEFAIKYKVLIEQPCENFLIYQASSKPADKENWLLDLNLAYHEFFTESSSLYLQDLELPHEFKALIQAHEEFFASKVRLENLKKILEPGESENRIRLKMLSLLCNCEVDWDKVLYSLFTELSKNKGDKYKAIVQFKLSDFLWLAMEKRYGYKSESPTIKDFLLKLLEDDFQRDLSGGKTILSKDAFIFINRWKENAKAQQCFEDLSNQILIEKNIETIITPITAEDLMEIDTYEVIDKRILISLRDHLLSETLSNQAIQEKIEKRKEKYFYKNFENIYSALSYASTLLDEINKSNLSISGSEEGFSKYSKQLFEIDLLYRKYIYFCENAEHLNTLKDLTFKIEKAYANSFLLPLGDNWQKAIDGMEKWEIPGIVTQMEFYSKYVKPYISKDKRIFVIISDALRYEIAAELRETIISADRYTAELDALLGSIPTYTQLGMASLLPHSRFSYDEKNDTVFVDGISSQGTPNRTKILQSYHKGSIAITAEEFLNMNAKDKGREFIKPFNVVYIYHNGIDKIGDDKTSESKVFSAVEEEFEMLMRIMKQIANMNGTNMIITADHGYLYQHNRLDESDFVDYTPPQDAYKSSRRFVLGKNLKPEPCVHKFTGEEIGLADNTEALIVKSINRIRVSGSGSRFVHGGASLQEIVIPVLLINKKRKSDLEQVEVEVLSGNPHITSNRFGISFYQKQVAGEKVMPLTLRAGFYAPGAKLISDVVNLVFDSTEKEAGAREKSYIFTFTSEATQFNGRDVALRLEEQIEGTSEYRIYKENKYQMLISFGSEFDDF